MEMVCFSLGTEERVALVREQNEMKYQILNVKHTVLG